MKFRSFQIVKICLMIKTSVADQDLNPDPDPPDPHVLGLPDPDPLVRGMDPDPAPYPSIIKGTVQRELRRVKIGINRTARIICIAGKCHLPCPKGHHHERSLNIIGGCSTF
jgi:hypothetical protein